MASNKRKVASIAGAWCVYLARGIRAARAGDTAAATAALERGLELAPREAALLRTLGRHLATTGEHERAAALLRLALEQRPSSHATAAALARLVGIELGRRDEARDLLARVERQSGASCILSLVQGELALAADDLDEAERAFEAALRHNRSSAAQVGLARAFNARGIKLSNSGHADAAARAFGRAARLDPQWTAPQVNQGVMLAQAGDLPGAIGAYREALRRDPDNPAAYFNLGIAHYELGDLPAAVQAVERVLHLCPDYPDARTHLANALVDLGEFDRAVALLLQQLDCTGDSAQVWSSLGLAYVCSGSVDRGEECLRRAVDIDANHFNAYYNLAVLYATQGRKQDAEHVLDRAFQLDPTRATRALRGGPPREQPAARPRLESVH